MVESRRTFMKRMEKTFQGMSPFKNMPDSYKGPIAGMLIGSGLFAFVSLFCIKCYFLKVLSVETVNVFKVKYFTQF